MEGVNEDIENWSVSQVLSWLKSTNDGQFDVFVPTFKQHQIYGDALLSLTNDILRDELNIVAYGARHALLKAICNLKKSYKSRKELQSKLREIKFNINRHHLHNQSHHQINPQQPRNYHHRKASMSSVCSKASMNTKTSHTYCVGDLSRDNADTLIDDNWENLNTMAKHGVVDPSEYLKQRELIVKAVTGTTVKLTRQESDTEVVGGADNAYTSGFFEFEDNIPNWHEIESQAAVKYEWNVHKLGWDRSYIVVKIAENPFSRGSLRVSYYCLDLSDADKTNSINVLNPPQLSATLFQTRSSGSLHVGHYRQKEFESMSVPAEVALQANKSDPHLVSIPNFTPSLPEQPVEELEAKLQNYHEAHLHHAHDTCPITPRVEDNEEEKSLPSKLESPTFTATNSNTKTNLQTQKGDLVSRLLGFESRYGGNLIVAKQSIDLTESIQTYFNDVRTQSVAQLFANEYNKYNPPKKVAFIKASVIQLLESDCEQFFCVEDYLHGAYMKHIDNYGGTAEGIRNTPSAFAHFTYESSQHRLLVCDIQGVGDLYTDPQIHTANGKGFGKGNLGIDGMIKFLQSHQCNAICQHLRLDMVNPKPIVYGTRPAKMYMDSNKISIIDHMEHLNNDEYHKMPKIPIATLNDFYFQQIQALNKKQSICEANNDGTLDDILSNDGNTIHTRKYTSSSGSSRDYNPLTPLIKELQSDSEDTKCGLCHCAVL